MSIRDMLLGAVITLVVTVLGGIIVYYLTRVPPSPLRQESLIYDIDSPSAFASDQTKLSFTTIRIKNIGNESAHDVTIGVDFDADVKIVGRIVKLSSGPAGDYEIKSPSGNRIIIDLPVLVPQETATVTILSNTVDEKPPEVAVKSSQSIGTKQSGSSVIAQESDTDSLLSILPILLPALLVVQLALLFAYRRTFARTMSRMFGVPLQQSVNNTAFVYLHSGFRDEPLELLMHEIEKSGADPYMLGNYALALGLKGDTAKATRLLDAAEFWSEGDNRGLAVVALNRAILAFASNNEPEGMRSIALAFTRDKREIGRYCSYSKLIDDQRQQFPKLSDFLDERGITRRTESNGTPDR